MGNWKVSQSWKLATIIPIPKPGKDHADPNSYRPIALTSCLCKTLERMINVRLVWYLESNNLIFTVQSGFRSERSINDNLVRLETFIRDDFVAKEHVVVVFFDLEKAFVPSIVPSRYFCGGSFCFMSWCFKKNLCCWRLMYVFIFLVKLR